MEVAYEFVRLCNIVRQICGKALLSFFPLSSFLSIEIHGRPFLTGWPIYLAILLLREPDPRSNPKAYPARPEDDTPLDPRY